MEYKGISAFQDFFPLLPSKSCSVPLFRHVICLQGRLILEKLSHHAAVILRELNKLQEQKLQILHTKDESKVILCPPPRHDLL